MEIYSFRNVSFCYPGAEKYALRQISFDVRQGEFLIICGPSGCGKSTLLRQLKSCLAPHGDLQGEIYYKSTALSDTDTKAQAQEIGFVMQSPENQLVTDKVWHELAFGLESIGLEPDSIRRRVAEVAAFFGIENWFYRSVEELSGGQKQLLSLASVMCMNPGVLVLDEPTAQLDPVAASEFLSLLGKINRELGVTVILTEHRLEDAFPFATRVIVMEKGEIVCDDVPVNVGLHLRENKNSMFLAMPAAMRVWAGIETSLACPLTVRDGSDFLASRNEEVPLRPLRPAEKHCFSDEIVLNCDELWFRYEKNLPDVVKNFSVSLHKGEFFAILGGNGAGKTTALKVLAGLYRASRGTVYSKGRISMLPQNPRNLFVKKTVREDLYDVICTASSDENEKQARISEISQLCGITAVLDSHPFDISGGEQQRAALAKVLLTAPDILLLDEPTKGFDAQFKVSFAAIIKKLNSQGVAVLMVSHDADFCAEYAHRCGLFFDGNLVAQGTPREFFPGNSFYTTPANRMARALIPEAVTADDIIISCGGEVMYREAEKTEKPLPACAEAGKKPEIKASHMKPWRKILAGASALTVLGVFFFATGLADLSAFTDAVGITLKGNKQLILYGVLFIALTLLLFATGKRQSAPGVHPPSQKKKLNKRTVVSAAAALVLIPLTIFAGIYLFDNRYYGIVSLLVVVQCVLPFIISFEGRCPSARLLVIIAVLCAVGVAGRSLFFILPQFKPVLAVAIIAGVALGGESGFLVGALTMLLSNMLFSQGPWTPWQMLAAGMTGFLAGLLHSKGWLSGRRIPLAVYGALAAVIIYGGIMNPAAVFTVSGQTISLKTLGAFYASGLPMDIVHGISTAFFILLAGEPMLEKLDRIRIKYGLL